MGAPLDLVRFEKLLGRLGRHRLEKLQPDELHALLAEEPPFARWTWCLFPIPRDDGRRSVYGSSWQHWAVHRIARARFAVTHLPSGLRLTEFDRLAIARRFCERIDGLIDWNTPTPPTDDAAVGLRLHQAALNVTGARPALSVVAGCRGPPP